MEGEKADEPVPTNGVHDLGEPAPEKREREDDGGEDESAKKTKMGEEKTDEKVEIKLGPKKFGTSVEMFDYFYKLLHSWSPNLEINKYEELVLSGLIEKGHSDSEKKIGSGIKAFEVRYHPQWKSRCFFLVRSDGTSDDFSFRKCVDNILPLPESMKVPASKSRGGGGGRGRRGGR